MAINMTLARCAVRGLVLAAGLACLSALAPAASAEQFMNINFDADTVGQVPAADTDIVMPLVKPYAIGGYDVNSGQWGDNPPTSGEGTIMVSGANRNTTWATYAINNEVGALYMDTQYALPATQVKYSFNLNVIAASTISGQTATLTTDSSTVHPVFGVNTFSNSDTLRFNAVPTSSTGGIYGLRIGSGPYQVVPFFDYTNGDDHQVEMDVNYTAGTVDVLVDGAPKLTGYAFSSPNASPAIFETFFYLNGNSGNINSIALDNISGTSVPEPASLTLLGLGATALLARRRRR